MIEILKPKKKRKYSPPVETFQIGSISIPVYAADQTKNGKVYPGFRFKRKLGKQTIKGQKASLKELRDLARTKVKAITSGKILAEKEYRILSRIELEHFESLLVLEKRVGGSLVSAFDNELLPARQALIRFPGISVVFAAQDYASRHAACRPMRVKWAAGRFLGTKRKQGMSKMQFGRLRSRLRYFSARFGNYQIAEVTELTIKSFLAGYGSQVEAEKAKRCAKRGKVYVPKKRRYEERAYNNQREDILVFMRWCEEQGLIPPDNLKYQTIIRYKQGPGARGTCSPSELKKLFSKCDDLRDEVCLSPLGNRSS